MLATTTGTTPATITSMALESTNPATGELIESYDEETSETIAARIDAADKAYLSWRFESFASRAKPMRRAAELLRERSEDLARLMAREMGKPVTGGRKEVQKCAWACEHYADNAETYLASETIETDAKRSLVAYRPMGVVLAVMPWNYPLWQVFRFVAPALMAGNAGLLKHASNVTGCALAIENILGDAGFPAGLFATLRVTSKHLEKVIEHPKVRAVTLTGSVGAGKAVAGQAGGQIKKTVLELGGSDAYVVLEDADLEEAAKTCVKSRMLNTGQSCIAAKRFVVVDAVRERFEKLVVEKMKAIRVGDPMDEATEAGPMAREDLRDELHEQVKKSIDGGAKLLVGGQIPDKKGAWYPPTVLSGVAPGQPAYDDEIFGPVAGILAARDEDDAIRIANDSSFGLGAAVFTKDLARGERIATTQLEAGNCFVNSLVKSDPRLPFGGIKDSGYGRELSWFGIREFCNAKTVYVAG